MINVSEIIIKKHDTGGSHVVSAPERRATEEQVVGATGLHRGALHTTERRDMHHGIAVIQGRAMPVLTRRGWKPDGDCSWRKTTAPFQTDSRQGPSDTLRGSQADSRMRGTAVCSVKQICDPTLSESIAMRGSQSGLAPVQPPACNSDMFNRTRWGCPDQKKPAQMRNRKTNLEIHTDRSPERLKAP